MVATVISQPKNLQLIPVSAIRRLHVGVTNFLKMDESPWPVPVVAGSLTIDDAPDADKFVKQHTFRVRILSPEHAELLRMYASQQLIAFYIDASGNCRMSGSIDYPLTLFYQASSGYYDCTLTGESVEMDSFIDYSSLLNCIIEGLN